MLDIPQRTLSEDKVRILLRKLRDLNLSTGPIAIRAGESVALGGCLSLDEPAEGGVRYRLRLGDGSEGRLEIRSASPGLELVSSADCGRFELKRIEVAVTCDRSGRVCSRALGARVAPETNDGAELEHFLRRIVRSTVPGTLSHDSRDVTAPRASRVESWESEPGS